jgi:excisionase family DNA binding protein
MSRFQFDLSDDDLDRLADRIASRLGPRLEPATDDGWMDSREAAEYLGISRDALKRHMAARSIPFAQDGPGSRCYFKRADLDAWRGGAQRLDESA